MKNANELSQKRILRDAIENNSIVNNVLKILYEECSHLGDFWVVSGCVCQSLWNYQLGNYSMYGISDIDIAYYDEDTTYEKEDYIIKELMKHLNNIPIDIDIKNQARVHLWYKDKYGVDKKPYHSVEDAIASWGSTSNCVGVRYVGRGRISLDIHAPYGLDDMFNQIIRINPSDNADPKMFRFKSEKWKMKWPTLTIVKP